MQDPFEPSVYGGVRFERPPQEGEDPVFRGRRGTSGVVRLGGRLMSVLPQGCVMCGPGSRRRKAPAPPYMPEQDGRPLLGSVEVHTLRWGEDPLMRECARSLDEWAARCVYPVRVHGEDRRLPHPKFALVEAMRDFVIDSASDWMLYVDSDVMVHPLAPKLSSRGPGFWLREDPPGKVSQGWRDWCADKLGVVPSEGFVYRNAGVWLVDRESARRFLMAIDGRGVAGVMEQHQWNVWLDRAETLCGLAVRDLEIEWNGMTVDRRPAWFHHLAGGHKHKRLVRARARGYLPDAVKRLVDPPSPPDFGEGAVVWPYSSRHAEWDELWYSHRSVLEHWSESGWPLVVFGDRVPDWWPGEFVHCPDYAEALWQGVQCADRVLWMNDDIFMLADQSPEDYRVVPSVRDMSDRLGQTMVAGNAWRRGLGQVLMRLHHHGFPAVNYSTHTPYLYERAKARTVLEEFGQFWKLPFETAYHNRFRTPHRPMSELKAENVGRLDGKLWVNPAASQADETFRGRMATRYGAPPR